MNSILQLLIGTWFIVSTNFPMWTKGNKTSPTFNYSLAIQKKRNVLYDEVRYFKKGKEKSIKGYDYQQEDDPNSFTWKGRGALALLRSHWRIVLADTNKNWLVIYFSKTLFTPEGIDIISRTKSIPSETIESIKKELLKDSILKKQVPSLKNL